MLKEFFKGMAATFAVAIVFAAVWLSGVRWASDNIEKRCQDIYSITGAINDQ